MFIQLRMLLLALLTMKIFLPPMQFFGQMIVKWSFVADFYINMFIVANYSIILKNMDQMINLYHKKALNSEDIDGKFNENVNAMTILNNELSVKQ